MTIETYSDIRLSTLLAEVLAHDEKATPGPWAHTPTDTGDSVDAGPALQRHVAVASYRVHPNSEEDCALIAHYRTAAPLLARECERLREELDKAARREQWLSPHAHRLAEARKDRDTARAEVERLRAVIAHVEHVMSTSGNEVRDWRRMSDYLAAEVPR